MIIEAFILLVVSLTALAVAFLVEPKAWGESSNSVTNEKARFFKEDN